MRFEQYNFIPALKANLESLGYKRPTDIQYKAIPPTLKGQDLLAIAQTGTGKTGAFAIPTIQLLVTKRKPREPFTTQCLVMVPTHELAIQVANVFKDLAKGTGLHIVGVYGGVEQETQIGLLKNGTDVLVATPGRMFDLASQGYLKFTNVTMLIIDEADHMLELGFINDMEQLIRRIPRHRQTLFFSATINTHIKDLAYGLVEHAVRIQISPKDPISKNIDHSVAFIEMDDKRFFLENLVKENATSKILVFVRTKVRAERVAKALERVEITSQTMHGSKTQNERSSILDRFKSGQNRVLIATDVSARGIDIPSVDFVVNYDLPEIAQNYVHRVGRTGRGTQRGKAVSFCSTEEKPILKQIETFLNAPVAVLSISNVDYEATIDFSEDASHDWKTLIEEQEAFNQTKKKNKKKR